MGDTSPNHDCNYYSRNPTFYYIGTLFPLGQDRLSMGNGGLIKSQHIAKLEGLTQGLGFRVI